MDSLMFFDAAASIYFSVPEHLIYILIFPVVLSHCP